MYWCSSKLINTCVFIVLTLVSMTLASSKFEFPIGVSFGFNEITSGYISGNGDFIAVASVQASQAWRDFIGYVNEKVENDGYFIPAQINKYSESDVNQILIAELSSIQTASEVKLNREIEILGFTSPTVFRHRYDQNLIDIAARIQHISKGQLIFAWPYAKAFQMGLQLNDAKSLGYPVETDINLQNCHLLHFDYQGNSIEVLITAMRVGMTEEKGRFRIAEFSSEKQNASPEELKELINLTKRLIDAELSKVTWHGLRKTHSNFRRIIFSGDAPASEFQKIRDSITTAIPEFADRFVEGVEPKWVGALGAARLAWELKFHPEPWEIHPYTLIDSHTRSHDDL